jgi:hypothetical protein
VTHPGERVEAVPRQQDAGAALADHSNAAEKKATIPRGYPPPPPFFGSVHSTGVTGTVSVTVHSEGLICTKIVQKLGVLGTAHSKGLSR